MAMQCYIPGGEPRDPFKYNPELNAGPVYTSECQGPGYKAGGVQINNVSVFMGVKPTSEAAEYFASNKPESVSLKWAEDVEAKLKGKLLGGNATKWTKETRMVGGGDREDVLVSSFNVPQGDLPAKYRGDLKNWEFGPTTEPLDLDFSNGINGEVGMITVGNNKHGAVPDITRTNWNDNVQVVWDKDLRKYVCQLDTYMVYTKVPGVGKAWAIKNTGGLITTRMYASGRYELRAKVPKAAGLVWAVWTFWGNEVYSYRRAGTKWSHATVTAKDIVPFSDSPMWLDQSTELERLLPELGKQFPNHEIDIEIPSNAHQTVFPGREKYDTMNMNCYRWTNRDGTGAYNNLFCHNKKSPFIGDGKYHTYRFDWHTGGDPGMLPRVDFYFDDAYVGTNDAFVPFMAGRLWVMFVAPGNGQPGGNGSWNGVIDQNFCRPSRLGDVAHYARVMVDYVRITPFKEPNDHYAPSAFDQPCMGTGPGCVDCGGHNPSCGTTSILPYTTANATGLGGIKWNRAN
jgi:hypothetical protein